MKKSAIALAVFTLASCSSLPELQYPDGTNRVPVNAKRASGQANVATVKTALRVKINQQHLAPVATGGILPPPAAEPAAVAATSFKVDYEPESDTPIIVKSAPNSSLEKAIEVASIKVQDNAKDNLQGATNLQANSELATLKYAVFFNYGSRVLTTDGETAVGALAQDAKNSERIEIVGRADNTGQYKNNEILARARAESVRKALLAHGVKNKNLVVRYEVAEVDISQDAKLKGAKPTNVAERSRRADVAMAMRVIKGQKEYAENTKRPVDPALIVAMK